MPRKKHPLDDMPEGWTKRYAEHVRCPACNGHVPPERFAGGKAQIYRIERVRWVNNEDGIRGGRWTPGFPVGPEDVQDLQWSLIYALHRVQTLARQMGQPVLVAFEPPKA